MVKKQEQDILGRAMLANVNIGIWEARKHDKTVTDQVNAEHAASREAGRYHKHLFGGPVEELSAVITAGHYLRWEHYAQTLPWSDAGWRLLPTANHLEYCERMRVKRAAFEAAVETFVKAYPRLVEEAREKLNGMYKQADYPSPRAVRLKYHAALDFTPIPSGDDFRVTLPKEEMKRIAQEVEERVERAVQNAMQDAWARLSDSVTELKERLGGDAKGLRDGVLTKLGEVADVLGRLNLTNDPALERARKQVLTQLATLDAKNLRQDETARSKAEAAVDAILKQIGSVYTPTPEEVQ